jgi:hypothetical protein
VGLVDKAKSGNELETLEELRDHIVSQMLAPDCSECGRPSKRDTAALAGRLVEVLERITALGGSTAAKEGTPKDEVEQRRRARIAGA